MRRENHLCEIFFRLLNVHNVLCLLACVMTLVQINYRLKRVSNKEPDRRHFFLLADSVYSAQRLFFNCGVPGSLLLSLLFLDREKSALHTSAVLEDRPVTPLLA